MAMCVIVTASPFVTHVFTIMTTQEKINNHVVLKRNARYNGTAFIDAPTASENIQFLI